MRTFACMNFMGTTVLLLLIAIIQPTISVEKDDEETLLGC